MGVIVLIFLNVWLHNIKSVFKELNGVPYQMHVFREMQFVSHYNTVVPCQPILRHSVYKNSAVYLSGARVRFFLEIRDLGSPTNNDFIISEPLHEKSCLWFGGDNPRCTATEDDKTLEMFEDKKLYYLCSKNKGPQISCFKLVSSPK